MTPGAMPAEWDGLGVELKSESYLAYDSSAFRAVVRGVSREWGGITMVSNKLLSDGAVGLDRIIFFGLDWMVRPWIYPKVAPSWDVSLFPRWDRMVRWVRVRRSTTRLAFWRREEEPG